MIIILRIREKCEKNKAEHLTNSPDHRVMFIPVDWRSGLKLDNGIVDSITIQNIPKLRNKLNLGVYKI